MTQEERREALHDAVSAIGTAWSILESIEGDMTIRGIQDRLTAIEKELIREKAK